MICEATTRSRTFDRKGRLEMGRKLFMMSGLRPGFLMMGVTAASFREDGTEALLSEELMILETSGEMMGKQSLAMEDGMGSSMQVEVFMVEMIVDNSSSEMGATLEGGWVIRRVEEGGGVKEWGRWIRSCRWRRFLTGKMRHF